MEKTRATSLFVTVIFVAVILSCTAYFGITAILSSPDSFVETPYYADQALPAEMHTFDRNFYLDSNLRDMLTANDYRIFHQIADQRVLLGRDDFLFPLHVYKGNIRYDYLEDYAGKRLYQAEELERFAKSLEKRRIAYENQGAIYFLAVIPNVQTVYREYLPWNLGQADAKTRLEQVSAYLRTEGETAFLDLSDALISAKAYGLLYNNTEDSLNALGAYAVYRTVLSAIPDLPNGRYVPVEETDVEFFTRYISGKELARQSEVASLIKNKTVSLSNDTVLKYQTLERIAGAEITYINLPYKDEISNRPALLLEFSHEWDKIQLMPYFSNTFGTVAYKNTPTYSQMTVDYLTPNIVVQFVHESELDMLLDDSIMLSYNDGLNPGDDPFIAMSPIVLAAVQSAPDRMCIVGRCEAGSTVRLTGDGIYPVSVQTQGERFIAEAIFRNGVDSAVLSISAAVKGKRDSTSETVSLQIDRTLAKTGVLVGENSMLFAEERESLLYTPPYTQQQLQRICARYSERVSTLSSANGKKTELVYAYIPSKNSIYGDTLEKSQEEHGRSIRLTQLHEAAGSLDGVTVLDLRAVLRAARNSEQQYFLTGRGLTPIGAYNACRTIILALDGEDRVLYPRARNEYTEKTETRAGGDLLGYLGLDSASVTEQVVTLTPKEKKIQRTAQDGSAKPTEEAVHIYYHADETRPVALVMRDEFGTALLPFLAESFSLTYVMAEGNFQITDEILEKISPDYVFVLRGEYALPIN